MVRGVWCARACGLLWACLRAEVAQIGGALGRTKDLEPPCSLLARASTGNATGAGAGAGAGTDTCTSFASA